MTDLLISLKQARAGLQALAEMSKYQSEITAVYVRQAADRISAAIQQVEYERRNKKTEPLKEQA